MRRLATLVLLLTFCPPLVHASPLLPQWTANGVRVPLTAGSATTAVPIADGLGGLFVVVSAQFPAVASRDIRVFHLLPTGAPDLGWPANGVLATVTTGIFDATADHAGGVYVFADDGSTTLATRISATGQFVPGWSFPGFAAAPGDPRAWAVDDSGGVWFVGAGQVSDCVPGHGCFSNGVVRVARLATTGGPVPGWAPPGTIMLHETRAFDYTLDAHGTSRGLAFLVNRIYATPPAITTLVLISFDGTLSGFGVGPADDRPQTFADFDGTGAGFITFGGFSFSALQKYSPGPVWPGNGFVYPAPSGFLPVPDGAAVDGAGGGYLRTRLIEWSTLQDADIRLDHVLSTGARDSRWPSGGVAFRGTTLATTAVPRMISDGQGGVFDTWQDSRSGTDADIYALRFASDASLPDGWPATGQPICLLAGSSQTSPVPARDGAGNLFVVWHDDRNGTGDIYAQRLSADAPVAVEVARATAERTDQGVELLWELHGVGGERLRVERAGVDDAWVDMGSPSPASALDQWRWLDTSPIETTESRYRLRQPSSGWTGGVVALSPLAPLSARFMEFAPNPLTPDSRFTLFPRSTSAIDLRVVDLQGREFARRTISRPQLPSETVGWLELAGLPTGLYWIRARQGDHTYRLRFVVTR